MERYMSKTKKKIVPPVSNAEYEIEYDKRPTEFSALTVWALPDELNFAVRQLEDAKRTYCVEHHLPEDGRVRVWTKRFTGTNWGG
tara:strand:- start:24 stop:278 length:255 start_codon:yes stop_codon:yes gene_type:complete